MNKKTQLTPVKVAVHPLSWNPDGAWDDIQEGQIYQTVRPLPLDTPVSEDKVRFVCMSDTHTREAQYGDRVPPGDVFLHAGDFTSIGRVTEVENFNKFLGTLPHKYKIVIAGNHELSFEHRFLENPSVTKRGGEAMKAAQAALKSKGLTYMHELLSNCTYLEDSETIIYGLRIYGSPWQPKFNYWAFNLDLGQPLLDKWDLIPDGIDVLLTHSPPVGHGDLTLCGPDRLIRTGCVELLSTVQQRVKPKFHVFGHVHEGYGITTDGVTTFINASNLNYNYMPVNDIIIFDIPLPNGFTKESTSSTK